LMPARLVLAIHFYLWKNVPNLAGIGLGSAVIWLAWNRELGSRAISIPIGWLTKAKVWVASDDKALGLSSSFSSSSSSSSSNSSSAAGLTDFLFRKKVITNSSRSKGSIISKI